MEMGVIMWGIGMVGGLISIYVRMEIKLKELDVRVKSLEHTDKMMNDKLDQIIKAIHQLDIKLMNKVDRD